MSHACVSSCIEGTATPDSAALRTALASANKLEWVVEPRERAHALAAVADIDVSDHEGLRDASKPHAVDPMQVAQRIGAGAREYPADVDEGSEFHVDTCSAGIEGQDLAAVLHTAGKGIAVVKASLAEAAQRLLAADHALAAADVAERPERHGVSRRQIADGHVPRQNRVRREGPERTSVSADFAVHGIVHQAVAAGQAAVRDQLHAAGGYGQIVAGVIHEG